MKQIKAEDIKKLLEHVHDIAWRIAKKNRNMKMPYNMVISLNVNSAYAQISLTGENGKENVTKEEQKFYEEYAEIYQANLKKFTNGLEIIDIYVEYGLAWFDFKISDNVQII